MQLGRCWPQLQLLALLSLIVLPRQTSATPTETELVSYTPSLALVSGACETDPDDPDKNVDPALVWMGTFMIVAASFLSCFAVNLQKWAINVMDQRPLDQRGPIYKEWRWLLGIITMIAASLMDLAALPFVPLSRVAALGCSSIVANIIITPIFLGEKLTKHDVGGCVVCVAGTVLACVFSASSEPSVTTDCLVRYFLRETFIVYAIFLLLFLTFLRWNVECYRRKRKQAIDADVCTRFECVWVWANMQMVIDRTGTDDGCFPFFFKFGAQYYPGCFATLAGLMGANSVMFAKTVLICFVNLVKGQEIESSIMYLGIFLLPFAFALYVQVAYLNHALAIYCDALFVLPVYQANWIVGGIACGMLLYQEYQSLSVLFLILFGTGVAISLVGLALLSGREVEGHITSRSGRSGKKSGGRSGGQRRTPTAAMSEGTTTSQSRRIWDLSASFLVPAVPGGSIFLPLSSQASPGPPGSDRAESPDPPFFERSVKTPPDDAIADWVPPGCTTLPPPAVEDSANDEPSPKPSDSRKQEGLVTTSLSLVDDPDASEHPCHANGDV